MWCAISPLADHLCRVSLYENTSGSLSIFPARSSSWINYPPEAIHQAHKDGQLATKIAMATTILRIVIVSGGNEKW